jgi:hypothetical protein
MEKLTKLALEFSHPGRLEARSWRGWWGLVEQVGGSVGG